jgi:putative FmdB family regulatory protein
MPTYAYSCTKCSEEFEVYQTFSDKPLKRHPGCGGSVQKVFSPVGIVLKGSGFYKNDSRSSSKSSSSTSKSESSESKSETKSESSSTSDSSSSKSDSKSDSKSSSNGSSSKPSSKATK